MGLLLAQSWHVGVVALAPAPPFLLGPPCMETFLNKSCASSPTACPTSSCVRGVSGAIVGGTEQAGLSIPQHTGVHGDPQGG